MAFQSSKQAHPVQQRLQVPIQGWFFFFFWSDCEILDAYLYGFYFHIPSTFTAQIENSSPEEVKYKFSERS